MARNFSWVRFIQYLILILMGVIMVYPFAYSLSYSLSDNIKVLVDDVVLLPVGFTLQNYIYVFSNRIIYGAFFISIMRVVAGVAWAISITGLASYAITRKDLLGKRAITLFLIIPMYITGGLIPTYVLYSKLGLFNTFLVYILPHGFWAFNMLLMRTYYETISPALEESARLDGAGDLRIYFKIIFPLSMPVISVIAMFTGVWQWNAWFDATLYVSTQSLRPLQSLLQRLIMENYASIIEASSGRVTPREVSPEGIKMATLMVSTIPIIMIYPFFQKYFIKGMMIGSVKA